MRNGLVYRKCHGRLLFYVPASMEHNVIRTSHDEFGHVGIDKTYEIILRNYWFPDVKPKIKEYIENCLKCIIYSGKRGRTEGVLHNIPKCAEPFDTLHIDHCGPFTLSGLKKHLFLVIDGFTKFTKLYGVRTTNSKEAIESLSSYFMSYNRPRRIISDRGSCFTSEEFGQFMEDNNIEHIKIATGSPQANGQIERVNRTFIPMCAKIKEKTNLWYRSLSKLEFALNNSQHRTIGTTPCKLLFGINQRGEFIDGVKEILEQINEPEERDLIKLRENASKCIEKSQNYNKKYFDKKRKPPREYKKGDYVMIKNYVGSAGVSKKLLPKMKGPYEIVKNLGNDRYVVADVDNFQVSNLPYDGVIESRNMVPYIKSNYNLRNKTRK